MSVSAFVSGRRAEVQECIAMCKGVAFAGYWGSDKLLVNCKKTLGALHFFFFFCQLFYLIVSRVVLPFA